VGELHSVFDPKGGYLKKGGKYVPSLVAEIGDVLEQHFRTIGMIAPKENDPELKRYLEQKKAEIKKAEAANAEKKP
jgi:23S rRNA A1618 N6-methylase RlmF